MLSRSDNKIFGLVNDELDNKMTLGDKNYPKIIDFVVHILNT